VIEEYNGNIDVRRNGRAFRYDLDDVEEAVRLIRRSPKFDPGDQVTVVDQDGYRRSLRVT
jgi:hypothetical protein